jgi:fucose permease
MVGIFFYVGVEIALAAIAIQLLPHPGRRKTETAAFLASFYFVRHHDRPLRRHASS